MNRAAKKLYTSADVEQGLHEFELAAKEAVLLRGDVRRRRLHGGCNFCFNVILYYAEVLLILRGAEYIFL